MNVIELIFGTILIVCISICAIYFVAERYKYLSDLDQMRKTIQKEGMEEAKKRMAKLSKVIDECNKELEKAKNKSIKNLSKKSNKKGE